MMPALPETLDELLERLGDIPPQRILLRPLPGTATEKDVIAALDAPRKRLCELVDGVLVEKAVGTKEARLSGRIFFLLCLFLEEHDLGVPLPGDGPVRLFPERIRIPDVWFISWGRLPAGKFPAEAIAGLAPDLVIEVLSESNTKKEMDRKRRDYFQADVRQVWQINPKTQTAEVYTSPTDCKKVGKNQSLDGGDILPGFSLSLKELFAWAGKDSPR